MNPVNYFEFDGTGSDIGSLPGSTVEGTLFQIGTFDYFNASTKRDKVSGMSFDLNMQIFDNEISMMFPTLRFDFAIDNTNDNNNPEASKDTINIIDASILNLDGSLTSIWGTGPLFFELGGIQYSFLLNGFAIIDPLTGLPGVDTNGDFIFSTGTSAYEDTLTQAAIYGTIQQISAVPVPAALWLFGSGLIALVGFTRNKNKY